MANWCSNTVVFHAAQETLNMIEQLFSQMAAKEQATEQGQLPGFVTAQNGWLHDIRFEDGILNYQTKWSPNTEVIIEIANVFSAGFTHSYEELGSLVYGEAAYHNGILTGTALDYRHFDLYEWDEEKDCYHFEGDAYECEDDILETLLKRKKQGII